MTTNYIYYDAFVQMLYSNNEIIHLCVWNSSNVNLRSGFERKLEPILQRNAF